MTEVNSLKTTINELQARVEAQGYLKTTLNLNDLNDKMATFKIKMKSLFLNVR